MEALIPRSLIPRHSLYCFSILASVRGPTFTNLACWRCSWKLKPISVCCSTFASPDPGASIYGGWEELEFLEEAGELGMLHPFRNFVISIGTDDRKHAVPFLLGFFVAFALSRVRLSTIALLPVSLLVFLGGFTMGASQAGFAVKKIGRNGVTVGIFEEKLKHLEDLFSDVDVKLSYLRKGLEVGVEKDELGMSVNGNYLQTVEHVKAAIGEAQRTLTNSFANELLNAHVDFDFEAKKVNQKFSRKRMDLKTSGINFFQFLTGVLLEPLIGPNTGKPKDSINEKIGQMCNPLDENAPFLVSDKELVAGNEIGECNRSPLHRLSSYNSKVGEAQMPSNGNKRRIESEVPKNDVITNNSPIQNSIKPEIDKLGSDVLSFVEEIDNKSSSLQFMTSHGSLKKIFCEHKYKEGASNRSFDESIKDNTVRKKTKNMVHFRKSESSSHLEHIINVKYREPEHSFRGFGSNDLRYKKINGFNFAEASATLVNHHVLSNQGPVNAKGEGKLPYSSNKSIDEHFEQKIKEAMDLLKCAREYMMTPAGEEEADAVLYKAAELLSSAVVMRPMSLIAVGQLGNIYLLHGELKLKVTRELRTLLLKRDSFSSGNLGGLQFKKLENVVASREDIVSVLVSVCEECEGLLIEAGRKYRDALTIDRNDVRALYNWGIALCIRAQLIADVGPEATMDADKIYLAAIDKFNAMISGSNAFAPDALYKWGMVLQQRSHLRPKNSREKKMFLHQARSLFEDVLAMGSENEPARDALVSCIAELNYNSQL